MFSFFLCFFARKQWKPPGGKILQNRAVSLNFCYIFLLCVFIGFKGRLLISVHVHEAKGIVDLKKGLLVLHPV